MARHKWDRSDRVRAGSGAAAPTDQVRIETAIPSLGHAQPSAGGVARRGSVAPVDVALAVFSLFQLWPFLAAFHQSADDNFWQYAALSLRDAPTELLKQVHGYAMEQGRVGLYPGMVLVLLGTVLQEFAVGRLIAVAAMGAVTLGFSRLLARWTGVPLTRPALLVSFCTMPMVAHHLPPNAYPLLVTLPLLGLLAAHLRLARAIPARSGGRLAVGAAMAAMCLIMEYAVVEGAVLAVLAVAMAKPGLRASALRFHAPVVAGTLVAYLAFRLGFSSRYDGNQFSLAPLADIASLQLRHLFGGTVFPYLPRPPSGGRDLVLSTVPLVLGTWLGWRLLPALWNTTRRGAALALAACLLWMWANTLPHALTAKYRFWCGMGECTYMDSRVAALGVGVAAAAVLTLLGSFAGPRRRLAMRLGCAGLAGMLGALAFLHNRISGREMAAQERAFGILRASACGAEGAPAEDAALLAALGRTIRWHKVPANVPPPATYLAAYRDGLGRLGVACGPVAFQPNPRQAEILGGPPPEAVLDWSLGPSGILVINGLPGSVGAMLDLAAYAPAGRADQRVVVRAGSGQACRLRLGAAPQRFHVAWAADGSDRNLVVLLETPDAVSPTEAGVGDDGLARGVHLVGVAPIWPGAPAAAGNSLFGCGRDAVSDHIASSNGLPEAAAADPTPRFARVGDGGE